MAASTVAAGQLVASIASPALASARRHHRGPTPASASSDRPSGLESPQLLGKSLSGSPGSSSSGENGSMSASRARRLFFLRAARPIIQSAAPLRRWQRNRVSTQQDTDGKTKSGAPPSNSAAADIADIASSIQLMPSGGVDPLPLHAHDDARFRLLHLDDQLPPSADASSQSQGGALSTAMSAVDWVLLQAQNVPVPNFDFDIKWALPWQPPPQGAEGASSLPPSSALGANLPPSAPPVLPPAASFASMVERRDALRQELEMLESMLRPQCPWPRNPELMDAEWLIPGDDILMFTDRDQDMDAAQEGESQEDDSVLAGSARAFLVDEEVLPQQQQPPPSVADSLPAGPRSAWPREAVRSVSSAAPSAIDAVSATSQLLAARCAWPRPGAASVDSASAPLLSTPPVGPRCAWPRTAQPAAALSSPLGVASAPITGARCEWPRKSAQTLGAPSQSVTLSGARCSWPRSATALATLSTVAAAASASPAISAAPFSPDSPAPVGARCAWPRHGTASSAHAAITAAATPLAAAATTAALGAHCPWPRKAVTSALPATAPLICATAPEPTVGARCAWPRPSATAAPLLVSPPPAEGARCSWPRVAPPAAAALAATPLVVPAPVEAVTGPRCPWPRVAASAAAATAAPAASAVAPLGPRCEWPKESALPKVAASPAVTTVTATAPVAVEEVVTEVGPRCVWPRKGAAEPNSAVHQQQQQQQQQHASPVVAGESALDVPLPLFLHGSSEPHHLYAQEQRMRREAGKGVEV